MKKLCICYLILFVQNNTRAQDTLYIKSFDDYFKIKTGLSYRALNFTLSPRINGITQFLKPILYRPIVRSSISADVAFKDLSIGWSFGLAQNRLFSGKQTESRYLDFQLHSSLTKKLTYALYYQDYQGYFIENITNRLAGNALEQRDDIRLKNVTANVSYIFNGERFSYSAAFSQSKKQLKNAGSLILTSSLGYFRANGDSNFISKNTSVAFEPQVYANNVSFYTIAISPGYAYTFLLGNKGWQISASVSGSIGLQYNENVGNSSYQTDFNYFLKAIARGFVGYHGNIWVVGVSGLTDIQGLNTKYVQYRTNNLNATFFCIYKIKSEWMQGKKSFFEKKKKFV
ncbi:MAG: DUF4421 family protein [Ferruginibacter sp.]